MAFPMSGTPETRRVHVHVRKDFSTRKQLSSSFINCYKYERRTRPIFLNCLFSDCAGEGHLRRVLETRELAGEAHADGTSFVKQRVSVFSQLLKDRVEIHDLHYPR